MLQLLLMPNDYDLSAFICHLTDIHRGCCGGF